MAYSRASEYTQMEVVGTNLVRVVKYYMHCGASVILTKLTMKYCISNSLCSI